MRITLGKKIALGFALVLVPMIVALLVGLTGFHTDVDTYAEVIAEGEALLNRVAGTKDDYEALVEQIATAVSVSDGEFDPVVIAEAREEFLQAVQALSDYQTRQLQELRQIQLSQEAAVAANFSLRTVMVTMSGIAILLGVIAAVALSYSIGRSMRRTVEAASRLADGDLTLGELPVFSNDEIGELQGALNRLLAKWRGYVDHVAGSVATVLSGGRNLVANADEAKAAAAELAAAIQEVSEGTNQQLSTIEGVQNLIERIRQAKAEIDESLRERAQQAEQIRTAVQVAAGRAEGFAVTVQALAAAAEQNETAARAGSEALDGVAAKTSEVHEVSTRLSHCMDELTTLSQDVDEVVQLSRKLADKAQLVSLASMGAAAAGDDRSNIAIIVSEVQQIARHAAEAREQIEQRMASVQSAMVSAAEAVGETMHRVEAAVQAVADARSRFDEMVRSAENTKQKVLEISAAAQELLKLNEESQRAAESMVTSSRMPGALEELTALSDQLEQSIAAINAAAEATAATTEGAAASAAEIQAVGAQMHEAIVSLNATAEAIVELTQQFLQRVEEPPLEGADVGATGVGETAVEGSAAEESAVEAAKEAVAAEIVAEGPVLEAVVVEEDVVEGPEVKEVVIEGTVVEEVVVEGATAEESTENHPKVQS